MARRDWTDQVWASKAETNATLLLSFSLGTKIKGEMLAKHVRDISDYASAGFAAQLRQRRPSFS